MRNHVGSPNKLHCVTGVFYVSVTMHKIMPFTARLLSFLILECADCSSCCRGLVLDLNLLIFRRSVVARSFPLGFAKYLAL